ncbi:MAG TPA: hypothetical protein VGK43_03090, partial [Solirubrobacterales bacterium]
MLPLVGEYQAADLRGGAEVEDKADLDDRAAEVIQQLGDVGRIDPARRLQLQEDGSLDQEVGPERP